MRPKGISQIVRVGMLSMAVLVVVSGAGLGLGNGTVEAQRKGQGQGQGTGQGQPNSPPLMVPGATSPGMLPPLDSPGLSTDPVRTRMDTERMKAMNDDRHKKLSADVDRLSALISELKSSVDKANKDELSVEVIRKAQEIEKLAHDVQSRMKN
jgi:hypothetical protein